MKITVKKLQGGECNIEVRGDMLVSELKGSLEGLLGVPPSAQTLVLAGKTLTDSTSMEAAGVKEGSKLHLMTRRTDTAHKNMTNGRTVSDASSDELFTSLSKILNKHVSPQQSAKILEEFKKKCAEMSSSMNLEDIQKFVNSDFTEF
ncbi:ubiquitin-like protein 4A [Hyalella azteca]|uniref:Ubiquitin-like protein 4A n=1 Tax=Hyalella azteca TaxID=294128 RepID=A0A8B7PRQ4_HYAAZ|nr:ubiquitin-like protein 4A [Hyalella azteca]